VKTHSTDTLTASSKPDLIGRFTDIIAASAITFLSFAVYMSTMSRSIPCIDGGELTTVLWTLGIAHPTGYPLFTLLGYAFVHIPFYSEVAVRANLFAAVCTAVAGGLFYCVMVQGQRLLCITPPANLKKTNRSKQPAPVESTKFGPLELEMKLAAVLADLSLVFSKTFWDQGTSIEVYPLQLVLFAAILIAWFRFLDVPSKSSSFFAGFVLGLGFTNHMTTILTVPALLFLFTLSYKGKRFSLKFIYRILAGGMLAGLLYLYLPVRASQDPVLNWGNPENLKRFVWLVSGKQFRVWMFSSFEVFQKQLGVFFSSLFPEFRFVLLIIVVGIAATLLSTKKFGSHRRYFWFCLLLLVSDLFYATNYSIHDIFSYFLLAYISLSLFAAVGFRWLIEMVHRRIKAVFPAALLLLIFPVVSAFSNFREVDESNDSSVENYTKDIIRDLPSCSLVLGYQWDNFVSASLYYQNVDGLRKDVVVVDKELLRRSWYAAQVHTRFAFLFPAKDPVYDSYQSNLKLFENNLPYNAVEIESTYSNFIREIITGAIRNGRTPFVGPEIEDEYLRGFNKIPCGLLFKLTSDTTFVPWDVSRLDGFRAAKIADNEYSHQILGFYERMLLARASYEYVHKNLDATLICLNKSLEVDPASQAAQSAKFRILKELHSK